MIVLFLLLFFVDPRPVVVDYPVSDDWPECVIGADFTVHSYGLPASRMMFTPNYLTVDVGVYPKRMIDLSETGFSLALNHGKKGIPAANPAFVNGPRTSFDSQPKPTDPGEIAREAALKSGLTNKPAGGFLYFPYNGDAAKIRNVSLIYTLGNGETRELVIR